MHLEAAVVPPPVPEGINAIDFGFDHRNRAAIALARTLWIQGYPDQAVSIAWKAVEEAAASGHPVTLCVALLWAASVFLSVGDLSSAEESIEKLIAHAERHSLRPYHAVGLGLQGELSLKRGELETGMRLLRYSLEALHAVQWELLTAEFNGALAAGLARRGEYRQAQALISDTLALAERKGDVFNVPELLRIKGDILASSSGSNLLLAEDCLLRSLELATKHSALAWELRAATSISRLWSGQGRRDEARDVLVPVYDRFTEGFESSDLKAARDLLNKLEETSVHERNRCVVRRKGRPLHRLNAVGSQASTELLDCSVISSVI